MTRASINMQAGIVRLLDTAPVINGNQEEVARLKRELRAGGANISHDEAQRIFPQLRHRTWARKRWEALKIADLFKGYDI